MMERTLALICVRQEAIEGLRAEEWHDVAYVFKESLATV